jgi:hypothetical protein
MLLALCLLVAAVEKAADGNDPLVGPAVRTPAVGVSEHAGISVLAEAIAFGLGNLK